MIAVKTQELLRFHNVFFNKNFVRSLIKLSKEDKNEKTTICSLNLPLAQLYS